VNGDALIARKPDLAYISLFIQTDGILLEDAVKEGAGKVDQIQRALRETYAEIRDIQIKDIHVGEVKPSIGFGVGDKSNSPRPEVTKSLLIAIPPNPELAVKIVDTACRMGCTIGNPSESHTGSAHSVIVYALAEPTQAHQEATVRAIAAAKEKASRIAKTVEKSLGSIKSVSAMDSFMSDDIFRRHQNPIIARARYVSASPDGVEVRANVSVVFELVD
jgi:uncharacterized protein YggE